MKKIFIDKCALIYNIKQIKNNLSKNTMFCAVVKSNAYGHNLQKVINYTQNIVDYYAVAEIHEAKTIRSMLKYKSILILGRLENKEIKQAILLNIEITVVSFAHLLQIAKIAHKIKKTAILHIKLNTGMNRLGVGNIYELKKIEEFCLKSHYLKIKGIYTHFATPTSSKEHFIEQVEKLNNMLSAINSNNYLIHTSASGTVLKGFNLNFDMVRIGIAMYGYDVTYKTNLHPVLTLSSKLVQIHNLQQGQFVGYDAHFVADKKIKVGVVGIGYGDGYMRANAKNGYVLVNGVECKIIGKICMNLMFVDLSQCVNPKVGDKVVLIGKSYDKIITATDLAKWSNTIEYEVLTNLT